MATLRKKQGGIYFVDCRYHGKRYRVSTKTSDRKLADLFLKDIEVRIAKDKFGFNDLKQVSLVEFFEKYLEFSRTQRRKIHIFWTGIRAGSSLNALAIFT